MNRVMNDEDIRLRLGRGVRRHRIAAGLTQEELARRARLHRTYIGAVERGERNLTILSLVRIARALDTELHRFLREVD